MATCIKTSDTGIVMTFGKYKRTINPGLHFYIPFVQKIVSVSNMIQQSKFDFRILTKDKVFATLHIAVQYKVKKEDVPKAYYSLFSPLTQINSHVENCVRSNTTKFSLAQLYESFDDIGNLITGQLREKMFDYGYTLENILVIGITPDADVEKAINRVAASERIKEAVKNEAEAEYTKKIKEAEAERDKRILYGAGLAGERQKIVEGCRISVQNLTEQTGLNPSQILDYMLKTQELDIKGEIGKSSNSKILFFESNDNKKELMQAIEGSK